MTTEVTVPTAAEALKVGRRTAGKLLKVLGVQRVVVVDDHAVPGADLVLGVFSARRERLTAELPKETDWDSLEVDEWHDAIVDGFEGTFDTATRRRLHEKALRSWGDRPAGHPLDVLRQLIGLEKVDVLLPEEWQAQAAGLTASVGIDGLLVLFDRNLGDGNPDGGVALLRKYLGENTAARAAVLTDTIDPGQEILRRDEIIGRDDPVRNRALISSKHNLSAAGCHSFINTLRLTANAPVLQRLADKLVRHVEGSFSTAREELLDIPPQVLEDIAFRSSGAEGAWELDTLLRLISIFQERAARRALVDGDHIQGIMPLVTQARKLVQTAFEPHAPSTLLAQELMAAERWDPAELVNPMGLPLANGDIFEVDGEHYILLCQPCDIALRSTGKRKADHILTLLPLALRGKAGGETEVEPVRDVDQRRRHDLPAGFPDGASRYCIEFGTWLDVESAVLDLCASRADGAATFDLARWLKDAPDPLTDSIAKRRLRVNKLMSQKIGGLEAIRDIDDPNVGALRDLLRRADAAGKVGGQFDGTSLTWGIRRVARLAGAFADSALAAFAAERARQAHDFDLDRFAA